MTVSDWIVAVCLGITAGLWPFIIFNLIRIAINVHQMRR